MSLDESIERLERLIAEVRQASLTDDKTTLGSALALRQEERLINEGTSEFGVVVFGDLNDFKQLNEHHPGSLHQRNIAPPCDSARVPSHEQTRLNSARDHHPFS